MLKPADSQHCGNGLCICCPNWTSNNTSHSFVPCSHSEALVSRKAVKEFPVEAHRSLRLELHACVLCINAAFQQCHVKIILIVCGGESGGGEAIRVEKEIFPSWGSLQRLPPGNPSFTKLFLLLFLALWLSLAPIHGHIDTNRVPHVDLKSPAEKCIESQGEVIVLRASIILDTLKGETL